MKRNRGKTWDKLKAVRKTLIALAKEKIVTKFTTEQK